jgi:hypothetical protein
MPVNEEPPHFGHLGIAIADSPQEGTPRAANRSNARAGRWVIWTEPIRSYRTSGRDASGDAECVIHRKNAKTRRKPRRLPTIERNGTTARFSDGIGDQPHLAPGENTGGWRGDGRCTSFG